MVHAVGNAVVSVCVCRGLCYSECCGVRCGMQFGTRYSTRYGHATLLTVVHVAVNDAGQVVVYAVVSHKFYHVQHIDTPYTYKALLIAFGCQKNMEKV